MFAIQRTLLIGAIILISSCGDLGGQNDAALSTLGHTQGEQEQFGTKRSRWILSMPLSESLKGFSQLKNNHTAAGLLQWQHSLGAREFSSLGYSVVLLNEEEAQNLQTILNPEFMEPVQKVQLIRPFLESLSEAATWGLDRIDQENLPLDRSYAPPQGAGQGVWAFVVDTGIDPKHPEFQDRVMEGFSSIRDGKGSFDCEGHGTHVAGTIGSMSYGVSPQVSLIPVRVLGCDGSGTTETVVEGVDFIISRKLENPNQPMVANFSLGGSASPAIDKAVERMVAQGISVAAASGNSNQDACGFSPARAKGILTVSASTEFDSKAIFSNYGSCVEVYAPGSRILSTVPGGRTALLSGTSMASPHVAGVAAQVLAATPQATPEEVTQRILELSVSGTVDGAQMGRGENRLLQIETRPAGDPPQPPGPGPVPDPLEKTFRGNLGLTSSQLFLLTGIREWKGVTRVQAELSGPMGSNFDILVDEWSENSKIWVRKGISFGADSNDRIVLTLGSTKLRFGVYAVSGSGAFELKVRVTPQADQE